MSIFGGIAFGIICGYLVKFIPERNDAFLVPLRVLLLLVGGLVSVLGSEEIGWGGAGNLTDTVHIHILYSNVRYLRQCNIRILYYCHTNSFSN